MKLRVARVKEHQPDKDHHVRQSIQRRIQKAAEACNATREACDLPVQHVEEISDYEDDACPEKVAVAEQEATADVDGHAYHGQDVRIDVPVGKPAYHRVDDTLRAPPDTRSKHLILLL